VENWGKAIYEIFKETSTKQIWACKKHAMGGAGLVVQFIGIGQVKVRPYEVGLHSLEFFCVKYLKCVTK